MWKSNHINLLKLWMRMSTQPSNKLLPSSVLKQHCKISHTVVIVVVVVVGGVGGGGAGDSGLGGGVAGDGGLGGAGDGGVGGGSAGDRGLGGGGAGDGGLGGGGGIVAIAAVLHPPAYAEARPEVVIHDDARDPAIIYLLGGVEHVVLLK